MKKISKYILLVFFIGIADTSFSCDPTLLPILMKDQSANPALNDFFAGLPYGEYDEVVKAWSSLFKGDVDVLVRTNTNILNKLKDYFNKYPERVNSFTTSLTETSNKTFYLQKIGILEHPNWQEVLDITAKVLARKPHVLEVENLNAIGYYTPYGGNQITLEGFMGVHSEKALQNYTDINGGTYSIKNKSVPNNAGVYDGQPIISMNNKEYVKTNGMIVEYSPGKYGGTSSFFPDSWDIAEVLDEVETAVKNNHGKIPGTNNTYKGFSSDGNVEIHFYYNVSNGDIISYFPKI